MTLNDENGTKIEDIYVGKTATYGDVLTGQLPSDVAPSGTTAGKKYVGWSTTKGGTAVSNTATVAEENLYALTKATYLVTFKNGTTTVDTQTVVSGEKYTMPTDPDDGVEGTDFAGWADAANASDLTLVETQPAVVNAAITRYAQFGYTDASSKKKYIVLPKLTSKKSYFDTGIKATNDTIWIERYQYPKDLDTAHTGKQGSAISSPSWSARFEMVSYYQNTFFALSSKTDRSGTTGLDYYDLATVKVDAKNRKIEYRKNDTEAWTTALSVDATDFNVVSGLNVIICGRSDSSGISPCGAVDFYYSTLEQGGKKVRDFVPVMQADSVTTLGLFDKCNNKYYAPQGNEGSVER